MFDDNPFCPTINHCLIPSMSSFRTTSKYIQKGYRGFYANYLKLLMIFLLEGQIKKIIIVLFPEIHHINVLRYLLLYLEDDLIGKKIIMIYFVTNANIRGPLHVYWFMVDLGGGGVE